MPSGVPQPMKPPNRMLIPSLKRGRKSAKLLRLQVMPMCKSPRDEMQSAGDYAECVPPFSQTAANLSRSMRQPSAKAGQAL